MVVFRIMQAKQMMQKCWAWSFNIFTRYIYISQWFRYFKWL